MKIAKVLSPSKRLNFGDSSGLAFLGGVEIVISAGMFIYLVVRRPNEDIPWGAYVVMVLAAQFLLSHGIALLKQRRWALVVLGIYGLVAIYSILTAPITVDWGSYGFYMGLVYKLVFLAWMLDWVKIGLKAGTPSKKVSPPSVLN